MNDKAARFIARTEQPFVYVPRITRNRVSCRSLDHLAWSCSVPQSFGLKILSNRLLSFELILSEILTLALAAAPTLSGLYCQHVDGTAFGFCNFGKTISRLDSYFVHGSIIVKNSLIFEIGHPHKQIPDTCSYIVLRLASNRCDSQPFFQYWRKNQIATFVTGKKRCQSRIPYHANLHWFGIPFGIICSGLNPYHCLDKLPIQRYVSSLAGKMCIVLTGCCLYFTIPEIPPSITNRFVDAIFPFIETCLWSHVNSSLQEIVRGR